MKSKFYQLTNPQKSILALEQFYQNTSMNNICGTAFLEENLDFGILSKAIEIFFHSHDIFKLRLCLNEKNEVVQYFADDPFFLPPVAKVFSHEELLSLEKEMVNTVLPLYDAPLFRFCLFQFSNSNGGFIFNMHHLIADAYSISNLATDILEIYTQLINNNLIPKTSSYLDFINSEQDYLKSDKFLNDQEYWKSQFLNIPEIASLSTHTIELFSQNENCSSKRILFNLEPAFVKQISNFCTEQHVSVYNFMMAIYSIYIGKVKDLNHFTIGTPILNRTNFKEKNTLGMFISTVPFIVSLENDLPFSEFLKQTSIKTLGIFRHQKYPYQKILEDVRKEDKSIPNLYNIMISYQNARTDFARIGYNGNSTWIHSDYTSDELDIHLFDLNNLGELNIAYDYQIAKYTEEEIIDMHQRIIHIIEQVLQNDSISISKIQLITDEEKSFILNHYNHTSLKPITKTVIELLEEQVQKTPSALAIQDKDFSLSYQELWNAVIATSHYLINNGINSQDRVCLFMENSVPLIVSILAILKIGACYIPMDVKHPIERIKYIFKDSNAKYILTNSCHKAELNHISSVLEIDLTVLNNSFNNIDLLPNLQDIAYIIYTSGSTGNPKGVQICHESLSNYIQWANDVYVNGETTNFPLYSSIAFDLTVTSIFTPLISGNSIYIYENENPLLLLQSILEEHKVQIIKLTPAHLSLLLDCKVKNPSVTKLIVGGDILNAEICKKVSNLFSNSLNIYNEYGPTEATVGCMTYTYQMNYDNFYNSVPIGIPAINTQLYVLNKDYNLIPFGYDGNLYVSGIGLSKGYINLPELNKNRFLPCPYFNDYKMYETGDIVKLYKNGIMEYIGRSDFQVKINGFRIEIGEIQTRILENIDIKDVYVTPIDYNGSKTLCAYYVCQKPINIQYLKESLQKTLPMYMIPKHFVMLDSIPLTHNGKVDKKALPMPTLIGHDVFVSPCNELEKKLHNLFCKLLSIEKMSVVANIFDYYVDSLTIIKAQTILYTDGYEVNTQAFYEFPSIRSLAEYICTQSISKKHNSDILFSKKVHEISYINPNPITYYSSLLLFGVTGFLGIHILHELLTSTNATIYCIIREKEHLNAIERFHNKFNFYFGKEKLEQYKNRIILITGDLLKDDFGLSKEYYNNLGSKVDGVISSAAIVKHYGNYEYFYNTNVLGTSRIMQFCEDFSIPMHYVSTMSVSGYGLVKTSNSTFTEDDLDIGQSYTDNVYVDTKLKAESNILDACSKGKLVANIYRIGNITNRFSDGLFQENASDNAFLNRISAIINLKCIPSILQNMEVEFTPVDTCAKFIVALLNVGPKNINIYHLYNSNTLPLSYLLVLLKKVDIPIELTDFIDFEKKLLNSNQNYFGVTNYIANVKDGHFNSLTLSNQVTNSTLKSLGLSWPILDENYMIKIVHYLKENKFIGDELKNEEKI